MAPADIGLTKTADRIAVHIERDFIALRSAGAIHFQITDTTCRSEASASLDRRTCAGPVQVRDDVKSGQAEEAGTFWLWVWPELLQWNCKISWLFSPPIRRGWRVGDLWGVDAAGKLLIIESKKSVSAQPHNPFEHFVRYEVPLIDEIRKHWRSCLEQEKAFIQEHLAALRADSLALGCYPGLVPYSKHRFEIRRWRHLYCDYIEPMISSGEYERQVVENLERYEREGCPAPHYFGLFTLFDNGKAALSLKGRDNYHALAKGHVLMFGVQRFPESCYFPAACEIRSVKVHLPGE